MSIKDSADQIVGAVFYGLLIIFIVAETVVKYYWKQVSDKYWPQWELRPIW